MNVALVHDYLVQDGGAEKVLEVMQEIWPEAPTYTLFFDPKRLPTFADKDIRTSFLQRLPLTRRKYQWYLPLMPSAVERLDLRAYDLVISSSSAFSKGVITSENALHVCYCHTPTRYLWSDTHRYIDELNVPGFIKAMLPPLLSHLRVWDKQAADRVDHFVANSETIRRRIKKYYKRDSEVVHPPVNTHRFAPASKTEDFFLAGGRLVSYKRFDLIIEACNKTGLPLKIFGSGPIQKDLQRMAGDTVELLGRVDDERLAELYATARAFLHPQAEDFGITPVEAMAAGCPVIAYRKGGATETVKESVSGHLFDEQNWQSLADMLVRFDRDTFDSRTITEHADTFSRTQFKRRMKTVVSRAWENHRKRI